METNTPTPENEVIARLSRQAAAGHRLEVNGTPLLILPEADGRSSVRSLDILEANPTSIRGTVTLATLADHIDYLKNMNNASAIVMFADRARLRFHSILDYHRSNQASWLQHRATTVLHPSDQLQTWLTKAGVWQAQEQFAEFLDENLNDIITPTPATVLDFVECLQCTRRESFRSAINQTTGEVQFVWEKANATDEKTSIVKDFTLGIPIWHRGEAISVQARLQHRIKDGDNGKAGVHFRFKLEHIERIQDKLWEEALNSVRNQLAGVATIYEGTEPEAPKPLSVS